MSHVINWALVKKESTAEILEVVYTEDRVKVRAVWNSSGDDKTIRVKATDIYNDTFDDITFDLHEFIVDYLQGKDDDLSQ